MLQQYGLISLGPSLPPLLPLFPLRFFSDRDLEGGRREEVEFMGLTCAVILYVLFVGLCSSGRACPGGDRRGKGWERGGVLYGWSVLYVCTYIHIYMCVCVCLSVFVCVVMCG